jgi:hypothetical protein
MEMNTPDDAGRDNVLIYYSYRPSATVHKITKFYRSLQNFAPNIDFRIVTYDSGSDAGTRTVRIGDVEFRQNVYNLSSLRRLNYPAIAANSSFRFKLHVDIPILAFWRDHPQYRRYWVIEDDVEYTGELGSLIEKLGATSGNGELLCTHLRLLPVDWDYISLFTTGSDSLPEDRRLRVCFLPFFCASAAALAAIDGAYTRGWNGLYEMLWPAVLDFAGLPIRDIGGRGPFVAPEDRNQRYIDNSPDDYEKRGSFGTLHIRLAPGREQDTLWHPIKTFPNWVVMRRKRLLSISKYLLSRYVSHRFHSGSRSQESRNLVDG